MRREGCPTDKHGLSKLSIRGVPRSHLEDARMVIGVSAVAVLSAIDGHAGVVKAHTEPVKVPVDRRDGVRVLGMQEVVHIELDRHGNRGGDALVRGHREGQVGRAYCIGGWDEWGELVSANDEQGRVLDAGRAGETFGSDLTRK